MKKTLLSVLALMLCAVMVFSFAACGGKDEPESTEPPVEENSSTEANSEENSTEAPNADSTEASTEAATAGKTDVAGPTGAATIAKPANAAEGIKLYNEALGKAKCSTANVKRVLGHAWLTPLGAKIDLQTLGDVKGEFEKGSGDVAAKLYSLAAADVASYSVADKGNTYVMTFKLKDVAKNKQGTQLGKAGYMYFFTLDEVEKVVMQVGKAIGGDAFEVTMYKEKSTFDLKSGVLTVTVDKTTGKMTAAALTLTEQIAGVCMTGMTGPVRVSADIVGSATVNFKVS